VAESVLAQVAQALDTSSPSLPFLEVRSWKLWLEIMAGSWKLEAGSYGWKLWLEVMAGSYGWKLWLEVMAGSYGWNLQS